MSFYFGDLLPVFLGSWAISSGDQEEAFSLIPLHINLPLIKSDVLFICVGAFFVRVVLALLTR